MAKRVDRQIRNHLQFISLVLAFAIAYWARDFLIPVALSILFAFVLSPIVERVRGWGVPLVISVLIVTTTALLFAAGLVLLVSAQVIDLTASLPDYRNNLTSKVQALRSTGGSLARLSETIEELKEELTPAPTTAPAAEGLADPAVAATQPVPVQLVEPGPDAVTLATSIAGPVLYPLATAAIVFTLVFFLLLNDELILSRMRWLGERLDLGMTSASIDEASERLGRYLLTQLLINVSYGVMVALALLLVGLPNALLWGILAALLRYVPYVGPWAAAIFPTVLSVAVFPGWGQPILVVTTFLIAEAIVNGLLEPLLYGSSTGVSSIGVVFASFFWGWLWGPVGLILAMPMTVALVVLGRDLPVLRTCAALLSNTPLVNEPAASSAGAAGPEPAAPPGPEPAAR
jgi:predicted PurR-regulated permease PerM